MKTVHGFTLLEVMVVTTLLAAMMIMAATTMNESSEATALESRVASSRRLAARTTQQIAEDLREAYVLNLPFAGSHTITYLLPVDHDGDGDSLDDNLSIEWGARRSDGEYLDLSHSDPSSPQTFKSQFQFEAVSTYDESAMGHDINEDGDRDDVFDLGRMVHVCNEAEMEDTGDLYEEEVSPFSSPYIVQVHEETAGDIDGDGIGDPIFFQDSRVIEIRLFVFKPDDDTPVMVKYSTSIALRNPQQ